MDIRERLILPVDGVKDIIFMTKEGTVIAQGYQRIVIGGRGAYIEFAESHMCSRNIYIPDREKWRLTSKLAFYAEYRSKDKSYVKIYKQKKRVDYADYQIGMFYMSPFDLISDKYPVLIVPVASRSGDSKAKRLLF